jgi:hypothetical protein
VSQARGQTLVLAALTALLITLMVVFTLSLGWRVRDRIENQMAADAAAYSQAVDVARSYNELALMNRTQVAMQVSVLSMSSLISWSSHYYSNLVATEAAMGQIAAYYAARCCPLFCPCECHEAGRSAASLAATRQERARVRGIWSGLEAAASQQLKAQWLGSAAVFRRAQDLIHDQLLDSRIKHQKLAATIAGLASPELQAPPPGDWKQGIELGESIAMGDDDENVVQSAIVTMGTRGDDFATARLGEPRRARRARRHRARSQHPPQHGGDGRGRHAVGGGPWRLAHRQLAVGLRHERVVVGA